MLLNSIHSHVVFVGDLIRDMLPSGLVGVGKATVTHGRRYP